MLLRGFTILLLLLPALASAQLSGVCHLPTGLVVWSVLPECLTGGDPVRILVQGGYQICWSPPAFDSSVIEGNQIRIYVSTEQLGPDDCLGWSESFDFEVPVGPLSPDSYDVVMSVRYVNGFYEGTYACDSSFSFVHAGDTNGDGAITSSDIISLVNYIFKGGESPCGNSGDVNCDGMMQAPDIIYLVNYVFKSGPSPTAYCSS